MRNSLMRFSPSSDQYWTHLCWRRTNNIYIKTRIIDITFPSSNRRVTIIIDWIRNCQIIRMKSCKVVSVGAKQMSRWDSFLSWRYSGQQQVLQLSANIEHLFQLAPNCFCPCQYVVNMLEVQLMNIWYDCVRSGSRFGLVSSMSATQIEAWEVQGDSNCRRLVYRCHFCCTRAHN